MARKPGIKTIAEGVETQAAAQFAEVIWMRLRTGIFIFTWLRRNSERWLHAKPKLFRQEHEYPKESRIHVDNLPG
ncbi:MAG: hypothetical protein WB444_00945 [Gallionella sp.]